MRVQKLVNKFTKQFMKVVNDSERSIRAADKMIQFASIEKEDAENEKRLAENFIKNFENLTK